MSDTDEAIVKQFISAVEQLAFSMPAPNPWTPQIVSLCVAMRHEMNKRASEAWNRQPKSA